jgi:hypothetical protein
MSPPGGRDVCVGSLCFDRTYSPNVMFRIMIISSLPISIGREARSGKDQGATRKALEVYGVGGRLTLVGFS